MRRVGERTCVYIIDVTNKAWMEQKKINRIMLKSLTEALSKEELASLWAWLDESDEHKRMYAAIRDAHALKSAVVAKNVKTVLWKRYGRWLVAACIGFALVVAGLHTFQRKEQSTLLVEVTEKEEVTLISDGHTYIVETDSVTDEAVEQQQLMRQVPKTSGQKNHLKVPRGKVFSIRLSDGTVVRLNAMSELHFPSEFTGDRRQVALTGEAFFDVARQPDCPFLVTVGHSIVRVTGTKFNVSAYADEKRETVSLLEGSVETSAQEWWMSLEPGEQATFDEATSEMKKSTFNPEEVMAWVEGFFHFEDQPLHTVLKEVGRWHQVKFKFEEKALKEEKVYIHLQREKPIEDLFQALETTGKIIFDAQEGGVWVVVRRGDRRNNG